MTRKTGETEIPKPKIGGSFIYCPAAECKYRTRRWNKYFRHWERKHV